MFEINGKYGAARVFSTEKDEGAVEQIRTLMDQPFVEGKQVRIMPDYHWGVGCTIGFTADLGDHIVPNLVGVDIGCGMLWASLGKRRIDPVKFDRACHRIPSGFNSWKTPRDAVRFWGEMRCKPHMRREKSDHQLGTLGGGNHFIELAVDDQSGDQYFVIHSGSRNLGLQVAQYYQKLAEKICKDADVPKQLRYLSGAEAQDYLNDMRLCAGYAVQNRENILQALLEFLELDENDLAQGWKHTVHNTIGEDNIIRKGAVAAFEGEAILIPMNMQYGSLLCTGKGNPDWNYSAPHGAGRLMGRKQAQRALKLGDFERAMRGVYSTTIGRDTLDEAPMAYKPPEEILRQLGETAEVKTTLRPLANFKAGKG